MNWQNQKEATGSKVKEHDPRELTGRYQSTLRGQQPNEATILAPCDDGSGLCSQNSFGPSISYFFVSPT